MLHDKLPTDDNLLQRGCQLPSICNLCAMASESSTHLFLECSFANQLWSWLQSLINVNFNLSSFLDLLLVYERSWSPQCKLVIISAIINCFNTIWFCRNQRRFQDKIINLRTAKSLIISNTNMSGNLTKLSARSSITEFVILKHFDVNINPPKHQIIKEIIWSPPLVDWVKCNSDGASLGNPGAAACGGIFRNSNSDFVGAFAINLGVTNALYALSSLVQWFLLKLRIK